LGKLSHQSGRKIRDSGTLDLGTTSCSQKRKRPLAATEGRKKWHIERIQTMPQKNTVLTDSLQAALSPLALTSFPDQYASKKADLEISLADLAEWIKAQHAPKKTELPYLKLATFGTERRKGKNGKGPSLTVVCLAPSGKTRIGADSISRSKTARTDWLDQPKTQSGLSYQTWLQRWLRGKRNDERLRYVQKFRCLHVTPLLS
jgi:hypothetical protein